MNRLVVLCVGLASLPVYASDCDEVRQREAEERRLTQLGVSWQQRVHKDIQRCFRPYTPASGACADKIIRDAHAAHLALEAAIKECRARDRARDEENARQQRERHKEEEAEKARETAKRREEASAAVLNDPKSYVLVVSALMCHVDDKLSEAIEAEKAGLAGIKSEHARSAIGGAINWGVISGFQDRVVEARAEIARRRGQSHQLKSKLPPKHRRVPCDSEEMGAFWSLVDPVDQDNPEAMALYDAYDTLYSQWLDP